uniref:DUF2442 domain-containing protein n=1 Tax=Cellvibrio fontiphilus TaxID=1815559 RepID=UPI002B4BF940|nr:DUF2442 domain-containing protein [Cellvibrio fontiphilus]
MNPFVQTVEPLADYKLRLLFVNGETKVFDVSPFLDKGIFAELKDKNYFQQVQVVAGAVEWPNEQDFSNDTLFLLSEPV